MKKHILIALFAGATAIAGAAQAQQLPAAVVAIVDTDRVFTECTACVAANAQLQAEATAIQQRLQALGTPLQTEAQAIQAAIAALQGAQPDAALQERIRAYQSNEQNAQRELAPQQQTLQRNAAYVRQQISERLTPIIQQQMQSRGANVAIDRGATYAHAATIEITDTVLQALNAALPSVSTTAPPATQQPATQQQPEGR